MRKMNLQVFAGAARTAGALIERKYLAHYVDASMGSETPAYVRLGKDLEDYSISMNADVEKKKNILGETSVKVKGYEPESDVDTYYATEGEALYTALYDIVNKRSTGSELETTVVDVLINSDGSVVDAWRENAVIVPESIGGDNSGMQIPFKVHYTGYRTEGTWDLDKKTFTVAAG